MVLAGLRYLVGADPAALAEGTVLTESMARVVCGWSDKLPAGASSRFRPEQMPTSRATAGIMRCAVDGKRRSCGSESNSTGASSAPHEVSHTMSKGLRPTV
jgi:hypothetical protein